MAALVPTTTAVMMTWGCNPRLKQEYDTIDDTTIQQEKHDTLKLAMRILDEYYAAPAVKSRCAVVGVWLARGRAAVHSFLCPPQHCPRHLTASACGINSRASPPLLLRNCIDSNWRPSMLCIQPWTREE